MKHALFLFLFTAALCGVFAIRTPSAENVSIGRLSSRNAAEVYAKNCNSCHGRDGRGKTLKGRLKHARNLADSGWQGRVGDERIFNSIMNGKGKMPAYGKKLSEREIDSLVGYVRSLKK
jgi:mono/diheme cytochrome c family protein